MREGQRWNRAIWNHKPPLNIFNAWIRGGMAYEQWRTSRIECEVQIINIGTCYKEKKKKYWKSSMVESTDSILGYVSHMSIS